MSAPWKGMWDQLTDRVRPETEKVWDADQPVIVTPIDDESLPHPGDGRVWETKAGQRVEILSPPYKVRGCWEVVAETYRSDGGATFDRRPCAYLSERKPEPEHRPWCYWSIEGVSEQERDLVPDCTCERRSGEERRQWERRSDWPYHVAREDRRHAYGGDLVRAKRGGRSGEDRRSP